MPEAAPALKQLPGGPDPSRPVPRDPVDGFDLAACAAVTERLSRADGPRTATLASFGLTEARWTAIESTWLLRIATALLQQDLSLGSAYDEALLAARATRDEQISG